MSHYVLLLLTLNATTGDLAGVEAVSREYQTAEECLRAAVEKGPQTVHAGTVLLYTCRDDRGELSI